jgi:hypothetical protein
MIRIERIVPFISFRFVFHRRACRLFCSVMDKNPNRFYRD